MATKKDKSRAAQYADSLAYFGVDLKDCKVLRFHFKNEREPQTFHHKAMDKCFPMYYLFDCVGDDAYVVIPQMDGVERELTQIAEEMGGVTLKPDMK